MACHMCHVIDKVNVKSMNRPVIIAASRTPSRKRRGWQYMFRVCFAVMPFGPAYPSPGALCLWGKYTSIYLSTSKFRLLSRTAKMTVHSSAPVAAGGQAAGALPRPGSLPSPGRCLPRGQALHAASPVRSEADRGTAAPAPSSTSFVFRHRLIRSPRAV
jgi:hypothetical protein